MADETRTMNVEQACTAQRKYQNEKGYPYFAPGDGVCWQCGRNIFQDYEFAGRTSKGYSVERAGKELITGCPHCHRSYCD